MNRGSKAGALLVLALSSMLFAMPARAKDAQSVFVASKKAPSSSNRLIVKLRPAATAQGRSVPQIRALLGKPLPAAEMQNLQTAAGMPLSDLHAIGNGAHVLRMEGASSGKNTAQAIAAIRKLAEVEYVEEDRILTAQTAPNDAYYSTDQTGNPGLWGLWPVTPASSPALGGTGSYGADFETAWNTGSGQGVVVAVVDTGITPHVDIVGPSAVVAAGSGSNLVSIGYDFISDCRMRGTCAANTPTASSVAAASADATDLGDFISAQDIIDNPDWSQLLPSNSTWHGTHVAGTIAALGNNGAGIIGGAYGVKILPVRVLGKDGGYTSDIAEGIKWAAGVHPTIANPNPARVINLSLGGPGACSVTEQDAINAAVATGAVVVVAAGNDNQDAANSDPANCQNVISVAAIARDGSRAMYSNYSSPASNTINPVHITLAAQGGDQAYLPSFDPGILSTCNAGTSTPLLGAGGSTYVDYQGTSMAAPHVAAAIALMLARNPALTPAQVKALLSSPALLTAFPSFDPAIGWGNWDCSPLHTYNCGAGILNANLAVQNSILPLAGAGSFDFATVATGSTGANKTVVFTNTSQISIMTGTPALSGADAAQFNVVSNGCSGVSVSPGASCGITMNYSPTTAGMHTAILTLPTADATVATVTSLSGMAGSALSILTPDVAAPTVTVGESTTVELIFGNPGATAQPTGTIVLSQPTIMATSADACSNVMLAAGAACSVLVTITPLLAGSYSGTASLGLSGGGIGMLATISGSATPMVISGGGCSVMPPGSAPDVSLLLALLAMALYRLHRRTIRDGSAG